MEANLTELRRSVSDQRILRASLVIGFVLGLAAHIGGYLLKSSAKTEPLGLIADLLYALGFALWTGVVVALFVQVLPEAKRRQIKRVLDAYDTTSPQHVRSERPSVRGRSSSDGALVGTGVRPF